MRKSLRVGTFRDEARVVESVEHKGLKSQPNDLVGKRYDAVARVFVPYVTVLIPSVAVSFVTVLVTASLAGKPPSTGTNPSRW